MLGQVKRGIGIIKDAIAHGKIKLDGDIYGIGASTDGLEGIVSNAFVITIDNGCGG
jgi:hypothetical protein